LYQQLLQAVQLPVLEPLQLVVAAKHVVVIFTVILVVQAVAMLSQFTQ
jgi:hypothetical protein